MHTYHGFVLVLSVSVATTFAANIPVRDVASFDEALKQAKPGDSILLSAGEWRDVALVISASGEPDRPITIRAAAPGGTKLVGQSQLKFGGAHVVVEGLHFHNCQPKSGAIVEFRRDSKRLAAHCTLRDCAITSAKDIEPGGEAKWLSLYGQENTVERCHFTGKQSAGTLLVVWLPEVEAKRPPQHQIRACYFGERPRLGKNGGETIRIGDSKTALQAAKCVVENNLFERCDGEVECISNKSCGNTYRGNVLRECQGTLTLRHGNGCTVEENIFLGNGRASTGGIRVIGEDHVVRGNYLEGLTGDDARAALCLMNGIENSPATGYFQVQRAHVKNNTIVACQQSLNIGYADKDVQAQLPPIDCQFSHNTIWSIKQPAITLVEPRAKISWDSNRVCSKALGIPATRGIQSLAFARPKAPAIPQRERFGVTWKVD